ncbi:MAG: hypothetical protein NC392_13920 [Roseburia sp.]|nr:hypothetical protein [Roseburia sp.]
MKLRECFVPEIIRTPAGETLDGNGNFTTDNFQVSGWNMEILLSSHIRTGGWVMSPPLMTLRSAVLVLPGELKESKSHMSLLFRLMQRQL